MAVKKNTPVKRVPLAQLAYRGSNFRMRPARKGVKVAAFGSSV
jgi:hypothetical protein